MKRMIQKFFKFSLFLGIFCFALLNTKAQPKFDTLIKIGGLVSTYTGDGDLKSKAVFNEPSCYAFDKQGNMYISDYFGARVRKIDATTNIITTIIGTGIEYTGTLADTLIIPVDSLGINLKFKRPQSLVYDSIRNCLYIASEANVIYKYKLADGKISVLAGLPNKPAGFTSKGIANAVKISNPLGMALYKDSILIFSEFAVHYISAINLNKNYKYTIAGNGAQTLTNGVGRKAAIKKPGGICLNEDTLYVADNRGLIRKINLVDTVVTTFAGRDAATGFFQINQKATKCAIGGPRGLAFDKSTNNLYISQWTGNDEMCAILKMNLTDSIIRFVAGYRVALDTTKDTTHYKTFKGYSPAGVRADSMKNWRMNGVPTLYKGKLYFGSVYGVIRTIDVNATNPVVENYSGDYKGVGIDGLGSYIKEPIAVAADAKGNVAFADGYRLPGLRSLDTNRIVTQHIFKGSHSTVLTDINKTATDLWVYDKDIYGICSDSVGNIYFPERSAHVVRKLNIATGIVTKICGADTAAKWIDTTITKNAADKFKLNEPVSVTLDKKRQNLYIADYGIGRIIRVNLANDSAYTVYNYNQNPKLRIKPSDVAVNKRGELFIAEIDSCNILKYEKDQLTGNFSLVTVVGASTDVANRSLGSEDVDGSLAKLTYPASVELCGDTILFILDFKMLEDGTKKINNKVSRIRTYNINPLNALNGRIGKVNTWVSDSAYSMSMSALGGNIYFANRSANNIKKHVFFKESYTVKNGSEEIENAEAASLKVGPVPVNTSLTVTANDNSIEGIEVLSLAGQSVIEQKTENVNSVNVNVSALTPGLYLLKVKVANKYEVYKIVKQ